MTDRLNTMLTNAVPLDRGAPEHFEHFDDTAYTKWRDSELQEIHTPQCMLRRIHEVMHARHTIPHVRHANYEGVPYPVAEVMEDCRLHINHWPWPDHKTPKLIRSKAENYLKSELEETAEIIKQRPEIQEINNGFWIFSPRLRAVAVRFGMCHFVDVNGMEITDADIDIMDKVICMIRNDEIREAAVFLTRLFFPKQATPFFYEQGGKSLGINNIGGRPGHWDMEIIELTHTVPIKSAMRGRRRATSGVRLHRPSLTKPTLPRNLFVRTVRNKPQGTILVDASGSMGSWRQIERICEASPYALLAYYAGHEHIGSKTAGQLMIYARDGYRHERLVETLGRGNDVDGAAIDWLLQQPTPRVMVTDVGFCGAPDSEQVTLRFNRLVERGEIIHEEYNRDEEEE